MTIFEWGQYRYAWSRARALMEDDRELRRRRAEFDGEVDRRRAQQDEEFVARLTPPIYLDDVPIMHRWASQHGTKLSRWQRWRNRKALR